jgi:hypothetical protein
VIEESGTGRGELPPETCAQIRWNDRRATSNPESNALDRNTLELVEERIAEEISIESGFVETIDHKVKYSAALSPFSEYFTENRVTQGIG